jgi:hypothetical protein
VPAI